MGYISKISFNSNVGVDAPKQKGGNFSGNRPKAKGDPSENVSISNRNLYNGKEGK